MTVIVDQVQPHRGIPSFAKKFAGETTRAIQTEELGRPRRRDARRDRHPGKPSTITRPHHARRRTAPATVQAVRGRGQGEGPADRRQARGARSADLFRDGRDKEQPSAWPGSPESADEVLARHELRRPAGGRRRDARRPAFRERVCEAMDSTSLRRVRRRRRRRMEVVVDQTQKADGIPSFARSSSATRSRSSSASWTPRRPPSSSWSRSRAAWCGGIRPTADGEGTSRRSPATSRSRSRVVAASRGLIARMSAPRFAPRRRSAAPGSGQGREPRSRLPRRLSATVSRGPCRGSGSPSAGRRSP